MSLRDVLRSGATEHELLDIISVAVKGKKRQHAGTYCCCHSSWQHYLLLRMCRYAYFEGLAEPTNDTDWWVKTYIGNTSTLLIIAFIFLLIYRY